METFKDVQIGQTFYLMTGKPCKKLSVNTAIGLMPEYCGFDWQETRKPDEFSVNENENVYGINKTNI